MILNDSGDIFRTHLPLKELVYLWARTGSEKVSELDVKIWPNGLRDKRVILRLDLSVQKTDQSHCLAVDGGMKGKRLSNVK
jgi:hypothetical protein